MIDLRSDTVTRPTPQMRQAIYNAEVGDDVYGEDPTVNRLQELAAEMLGKEDALLVTSGTQGNLVSILTHCPPATEIILEESAHIFLSEAGSAAAFAGVQLRTLKGERGALSAESVRAAIRAPNIHHPPTSLICLENTHNRAGGAVIPLDKFKAVYSVALEHGLPLHLDGARLFNAAVAAGVPAREYASQTTTVQICLSKGLAAPVGSIIAGPHEWITAARVWRKRLGGGMRQAGIIAAAGILALTTMVERLAEDHANARLLADRLAGLPGVELDPGKVETNMVLLNLKKISADQFVEALKQRAVLALKFGPRLVRLTTHKDITRADIEKTAAAARSILGT